MPDRASENIPDRMPECLPDRIPWWGSRKLTSFCVVAARSLFLVAGQGRTTLGSHLLPLQARCCLLDRL